jgi:hypothetical protein
MSYRFLNVVDLQSRQYPFDIEGGITIKTATDEFDVTLEDCKEKEIFDLISANIIFQVVGKTACFTVNPSNIVGILFTQN